MRTAAAVDVEAKYLDKENLYNVTIFGSGSQSRFQLKALLDVKKPEELRVWNRNEDHVYKYIEEMYSIFPLKFH